MKKSLLFEQLESRNLLAVLHNDIFPADVDHDGLVAPIDCLEVINYINAGRPTNSPAQQYLDTSGDGFVTSIDALEVINFLNMNSSDRPRVTYLSPTEAALPPDNLKLPSEAILLNSHLDVTQVEPGGPFQVKADNVIPVPDTGTHLYDSDPVYKSSVDAYWAEFGDYWNQVAEFYRNHPDDLSLQPN